MTALKKILSAVLSVVFIVSLLPQVAWVNAQETDSSTTTMLSTDMAWGAPGSTVDVNVYIKNNPGVLGATVAVTYSPMLTLVGATKGEAFMALDMARPGQMVSPCKFAWDTPEIKEEDVKDGVILTLSFAISEEAPVGEFLDVAVTSDGFYDNDLNVINVAHTTGSIKVIDYTPGDVNEDGKIDTADVISLRRMIVGGYSLKVNEAAADVNEDGLINTADVVSVRRYIVGGYNVVLKPRIERCAHEMIETPAKAVTCTEDGNIAYWYCTACELYFSDAEGENEINVENTVIVSPGHTEVVDEAVEPTYNSTGLTEGSHCSTCGEVLNPQEIIPALQKEEYAITYHIANNDTYLAGVEITNNNPDVYTKEDGLVLQDLIVPGYNFKGWYTAQTGGTKVTEIAAGTTENKVFYAQWEKVEYTVTFDSPDVPVASVTYTVDRGVTLTNPAWFGYTFVGWSMNGKIVTSIQPGTTGNITLHANWTSNRNRAKAVTTLADPIIIEDMDEGQYLFVYEIGTIENVPLSVIEYIGNSQGITIDNEYEYSKSVQEGFADTIAKSVSNATVKTSAWTLSEDWNSSASATAEHEEQKGKTNETTDSEGNVTQSQYYVSNVEGGATAVSSSSGGSNGSSAKVALNNSVGINGTYSHESESSETRKQSVELSVGASGSIGPVELSGGVEYNQAKETTESDKDAFSLSTSRDKSVGVEGSSSSESHWDSSKTSSSSWNTETGYEIGESVSKNSSVSNVISEAVNDRFAYSSMDERGGSNSSTHSTDESQELTDEYASTVEYSTEVSEKVKKAVTYSSDATGYYRLVSAGTVHVFAVVGYDIATNAYFTYTYNILDKERHEYLDYSKDNANFNDCENAILPFEIPYFVHEFTSSVVAKSDGLVVDTETGTISEYNGDAEYVLIPEYVSVYNGDKTYSAIRIRGIEENTFKGNTNIKGVSLPKYVTKIPDNAFAGCTSLETVMGYGIMEIGDNAFGGCGSLGKFTVDAYVTELGQNAFQGAPEIEVVAANESVVSATIESGAKSITVNLSEMETPIANTNIEIADTVEYFALIGDGSNYENIQIESNAKETFISNMNFVDNTDTPFKFGSQSVTLSRVSVTDCPGFALILTADQTTLSLYGTIGLSSLGDSAVISKTVTLQKANSEVAGKLRLTGDYLLYGEMTNQSMLTFVDGELLTINEEKYNSMLTSSVITFDANGGDLSEDKKIVYYGQYYGEMPMPKRTGYAFDGWYTEQTGGTKVTAESIVSVLANQTLYAHWTTNAYNVSWNTGTGYTIAVKRTSSPYADAAVGALSNSDVVYYGDVLAVTYTANTGYSIRSNGYTEITVDGDVTSSDIYATASVNSYTASWNTGTGYTITVRRTASPKAGASIADISSGATVYYGDVLEVSYAKQNYYHLTSIGETSITVTGNVTSSSIYATAALNDVSGWVSASSVPTGAQIINEKWTYTYTENTTSTSSSLSGWTQTGSSWRQTGTGTHYYASFPSSYQSDSLSQKYKGSALANSETTSTKRTVSSGSFHTYVYYHWCYALSGYHSEGNRPIGTYYGEFISGYGTCNIQESFESTTNQAYNSAAGCYQFTGHSTYSYWWFRTEVYKQTYTDYEKLYSYTKQTQKESTTSVTAGGQISNVQKLVQYRPI